ncbi:DUF433 domain-containing protein [Occultella gossypii]|uniref:DUF433 domain-containing protein n=1 Tax=Occultella gossypii TaxID=2800820 RepID=A0ABS7SCS3_9MICO|nr:DUF433 domain-containing protein [Occultella gossypii]MBZ2198168.1 DUF433 domain-containing protein [Occultella gossypii]
MTTLALLEREMYSEAEASRLLRVPQGTLHYWLEGGTRGHVTYLPVLRAEPTRRRVVTWAEFVEAGLLKQYRRDLQVPMPELRQFISLLRESLGVPYPLATFRPWSIEKRLVIEAQEQAGLSEEYWVYAVVGDQPLLLPPGKDFLARAEFDGDVAVRWRPSADPESPVVVDPNLRFGKPAVHGISTDVLWEYSEDGYTEAEIAKEFAISKSDVAWAVAYENSGRAA